jgi:hypothetical protein
MKIANVLFFGIAITILTSCATAENAGETEYYDPCSDEKFSFLTILNATNDASMDFYIDGRYLATVAPAGEYFLEQVSLGDHEVEARESNGFRAWIQDIEVPNPCEDIIVELGN